MECKTANFTILVKKLLWEPELVIDVNKWANVIRSINRVSELEILLDRVEVKFRPKEEIDCYPAYFPLAYAIKVRIRELSEGGSSDGK